MNNFFELLKGGDLRSIGLSNQVASLISNQQDFDNLFQYLFHKDRLIAMRAADAIEKVTAKKDQYLHGHKKEILQLCKAYSHKEIKWHLALLVSRLILSKDEPAKIWKLLSSWVIDKNESRIVRVNAIQGLFNLLQKHTAFVNDFEGIITNIETENIPSLNARIRKLKSLVARNASQNQV
jgi:hypothetical protein